MLHLADNVSTRLGFVCFVFDILQVLYNLSVTISIFKNQTKGSSSAHGVISCHNIYVLRIIELVYCG